jgi:DNA-binding phage protein
MPSKNLSKRKSSVSHDKVMARRLYEDADFVAESLKAALEEKDEPSALLIALRHLAQAQELSTSIRI